MWQLLLVFYFLFGAASYLFRRELAQKLPEHNRAINVVFFVVFLLPSGLILSVFFPHNLHVGTLNLVLLLGGSIVWPIQNILAFRANKEVDVGIFTILNNLSPVVTLAIALPFLNESLHSVQFTGIALLIFSGVIAAASQLHGHKRASLRGIMFCLLATAVLGLGVAYERFMLTRVDFGAYLIFGWGSQILWAVILAERELKKLPALLHKSAPTRTLLLSWGASSVLKSIAFILALKLANASLISSASDFMSVAVVIAAYFYLREREHIIYKSIAVAIGIVGLLLIAG